MDGDRYPKTAAQPNFSVEWCRPTNALRARTHNRPECVSFCSEALDTNGNHNRSSGHIWPNAAQNLSCVARAALTICVFFGLRISFGFCTHAMLTQFGRPSNLTAAELHRVHDEPRRCWCSVVCADQKRFCGCSRRVCGRRLASQSTPNKPNIRPNGSLSASLV